MRMLPDDARKAIIQRIEGNLPIAFLPARGGPEQMITRELVDFDNEDSDRSGTDYYVRVSLRHNGRQQATLGEVGDRKFLVTGTLFIQVFVVTNIKTFAADQIAQAFASQFDALVHSGISFGAAVTREGPVQGKHFQMTVDVPFDYFDKL